MRSILLWIAVSLVFAVFCCGLLGYNYINARMVPMQPVSIQVAPGSTLAAVAEDLAQERIINRPLVLKLIARWKGQGHQIKAGSYYFDQPATAAEVLQRLISADVERVTLTVPEGFTQKQIIERIVAKGFGEKSELEQLVSDKAFIESLNVPAQSLEGYLFPETYTFVPGIKEANLLSLMVRQLDQNLTTEITAAAKKLGLNKHELITLASIIEKETGQVDEMPLISSVFHNRLKRGIPLQTDPTVIYGIKDFDGNITRKHLRTPTPYNTYVIRGLPPGPIASPGASALKAAAFPALSKYLYFVSRGDGSHQFSKNLKDHNAAVRKYQLRRRKK